MRKITESEIVIVKTIGYIIRKVNGSKPMSDFSQLFNHLSSSIYDEKTANIGVKHLIELYLDDLLLNYKLEDKFG